MHADTQAARDAWRNHVETLVDAIKRLEREAKDATALTKKVREGFKTFDCGGSSFEMELKYEGGKAVGNGAYGVVISVVDTTTGKMLKLNIINQY